MLRDDVLKTILWSLLLSLSDRETPGLIAAADEVYADTENDQRSEELVKELCDVVFVCYQFAATYDIDLDTAMCRVFESNMSKLGIDGSPIYRADGKVLKGPRYHPPMLNHLFPQSKTNYDTNGKYYYR